MNHHEETIAGNTYVEGAAVRAQKEMRRLLSRSGGRETFVTQWPQADGVVPCSCVKGGAAENDLEI